VVFSSWSVATVLIKCLYNVQAAPAEEETKSTVYSKDSFFDSLSCEALERAEEREGEKKKPTYSEQRKIDIETFGASSLDRRSGRGRGRRYYNNNNNNNNSGNNSGGGGNRSNRSGGARRGNSRVCLQLN
jgi:protein LSM14